jgi:hypothetical protein
MKIIKEWHYLVRVLDFDKSTKWRIYCLGCLARIVKYEAEAGFRLEVISYSAGKCSVCDAVHVTPPGSRPPFKMRNVTYQINASYPEYDLTA